MAGPSGAATTPDSLDASGLRIGMVAARWNAPIVERLADGVRRAVARTGAQLEETTVPGSFELPFGASLVAARVDAIVVVGAVVRGETTHYELVSEQCAAGVMRVQLDTGVPIGFGVLTVESEAQALARSEPAGGHNVGEEAALAAIELALRR